MKDQATHIDSTFTPGRKILLSRWRGKSHLMLAMSMTEKIVVYMAQPLLGKGYQLYMDNWYSGVSLYLYLKSKNPVSCGTIKENRCPVTVRQLQLEEGE